MKLKPCVVGDFGGKVKWLGLPVDLSLLREHPTPSFLNPDLKAYELS